MVHINPAMTHNSLVFVTYEHVNKSKDYCQYSKWKYKAQYYGVRIYRYQGDAVSLKIPKVFN